MSIFNLKNQYPFISVSLVFIILIIITLATKFYGSTDIGDYADTAKYFAGEYSAKIRNTHSYLFGFIHYPLVKLTKSFFIYKIINLIILAGIVYSVYCINERSKKSLWLMMLSPIIWYMAPWISPVMLSSLFLLWAFYHIRKYDISNNLRNLLYSGIFIGFAWAVWDTMLYFGAFLAISFLYNRKLNHLFFFVVALMMGLFPRIILDQFIFGFPFYTVLKSFSAGIVFSFLGGIYNSKDKLVSFSRYFFIIIVIPLKYWNFYKPRIFLQNKKVMIFLTLSLLLIFISPQIRYTFAIIPIITVLIGQEINRLEYKRQLYLSIILIIILSIPYILQVFISIDERVEGVDFEQIILGDMFFKLSKDSPSEIMQRDFDKIILLTNATHFIVGPNPDDYRVLAYVYWGDKIEEFVSVQDYELAINNKTLLFSRSWMPVPKIAERRQIWIEGGISKNENDLTDYNSLEYLININDKPAIEGFEKVADYEVLTLWRKKLLLQ